MRSKLKVEVLKEFTLHLSEGEAQLLRALVQNPISDNEPVAVTRFRQDVYDALDESRHTDPTP